MFFAFGNATQTRLANGTFMNAFLPRAYKYLFNRIGGSYVSKSLVEPLPIMGTLGHLKRFQGSMTAQSIPTWLQNVPNNLYKTVAELDRSAPELDQTRQIMRIANDAGIRIGQHPDLLTVYRIMNGSAANSQYEVADNGTKYTITMDGLPFFSASHQTDGKTNQSNIVQGGLPATVNGYQALDEASKAKIMLNDMGTVVQAFKTFKDNTGAPIFPTLDSKTSLVVLTPSLLETVSAQVFATPGGVIDMTTGIGHRFVKEVISTGYLDGSVNPNDSSPAAAAVSPLNPTDYYVAVVDDVVKPLYYQIYEPPTPSETLPFGNSISQARDEVMRLAAVGGITLGATEATIAAAAIVDTTFARVGAQADAYTILNEKYLVSPRVRDNVSYGPWFTMIRVKANGGN